MDLYSRVPITVYRLQKKIESLNSKRLTFILTVTADNWQLFRIPVSLFIILYTQYKVNLEL